MKTLLIGLFVGLTSLMNAQNFTQGANQVALNEVKVTSIKNAAYYEMVHEPNAPSQARMLETEVGKYDITSATVYSKNHTNYDVLFTCAYGNILASFNSDGLLLNSDEKFAGIRLPENVRIALRNNYPDWKLNTTEYRVKYNVNKDVKRVYEVQLTNENKKMNLKIDCNGVILNPKNI